MRNELSRGPDTAFAAYRFEPVASFPYAQVEAYRVKRRRRSGAEGSVVKLK